MKKMSLYLFLKRDLKNKDKHIVYKAFANVNYPLDNINILHTDIGNEFKNSMFVFNSIFKSFEELETSLFDYVNWYNKFRVHSSLRYLSPIEYKAMLSEKNKF